MVNVLEGLYGVTAVLLLAAVIQFARSRRTAARRLAWFAAGGIALSAALYWYLRPSA